MLGCCGCFKPKDSGDAAGPVLAEKDRPGGLSVLGHSYPSAAAHTRRLSSVLDMSCDEADFAAGRAGSQRSFASSGAREGEKKRGGERGLVLIRINHLP